jgi:hypothetical protein
MHVVCDDSVGIPLFREFRYVAGDFTAIATSPQSLLGLYETAMLFIPSLLGSKVPVRTAEQNIKFLSMCPFVLGNY